MFSLVKRLTFDISPDSACRFNGWNNQTPFLGLQTLERSCSLPNVHSVSLATEHGLQTRQNLPPSVMTTEEIMQVLAKLLSVLLIFSGCMLTGTVQAGYVYNGGVVVSGSSARGSVRDARDNPGTIEYIGCSYEAYQSGSGYFFCSARSGSGTYMSCYQYSPSDRLLMSIQSINEASYIEFRRDSSNRCSMVIVRNSSQYL